TFFALSHLLPSHLFFFNHPPTTEIYTLSLHDALPIFADSCQLLPSLLGLTLPVPHTGIKSAACQKLRVGTSLGDAALIEQGTHRSEEHTSELQSRRDLVCRLLLEKKKKKKQVTRNVKT